MLLVSFFFLSLKTRWQSCPLLYLSSMCFKVKARLTRWSIPTLEGAQNVEYVWVFSAPFFFQMCQYLLGHLLVWKLIWRNLNCKLPSSNLAESGSFWGDKECRWWERQKVPHLTEPPPPDPPPGCSRQSAPAAGCCPSWAHDGTVESCRTSRRTRTLGTETGENRTAISFTFTLKFHREHWLQSTKNYRQLLE